MVTLNDVFLGGQAKNSNSAKYCGILFWLNSKAKRKKIYQFSSWTVELSHGDFIIARTTDQLSNADLKSQGYSICEKALDIYSADGYGSHFIISPFDRYLLVSNIAGKEELWISCSERLTFHCSATVSLLDKNGNPVPRSPSPQTQWDNVYSYYRYSKISNNIYDEYRWMYLVFEVLMQGITPIAVKANGKNAESEKEWIRRALQIAESTYNWTAAVSWPTTDHIAYFLDHQYDKVRCNLFHSKGGQLIPNDQISLDLVNKHLKELDNLCVYLLKKKHHVQTHDSWISQSFFNSLMTQTFLESKGYLSAISIESFQNNDFSLTDVNPFLYLEEISSKAISEPYFAARVFHNHLTEQNSYTIYSYGICQNNSPSIFDHANGHPLVIDGVDDIYLIQLIQHVIPSQVKQHKQSGIISHSQAQL